MQTEQSGQKQYARLLTTDDRKVIRKLEKEPWNRLKSISEDAHWVEQVADLIPHLPVVGEHLTLSCHKTHPNRSLSGLIQPIIFAANLRCGAWYVAPALSARSQGAATFCYFKSTDGHADKWDFSLKRPNLAVIRLIAERDGVIIVDSTRRGKSLPDALSKTIPIWCAVVSEASRRKYGVSGRGEWAVNVASEDARRHGQEGVFRVVNDGAGALYTPSHQVPPSEHSQIEVRLESWIRKLLASDLPIPRLAKPLVPFFLTRPSSLADERQLLSRDLPSEIPFDRVHPVILLNASKKVDLPSPSPNGAYYYTQGSGDDEEMWSLGLNPAMFWEAGVHERLLSTPRKDLASLIAVVVNEGKKKRPAEAVRSASQGLRDSRVVGSAFFCGRRAAIHYSKNAAHLDQSALEGYCVVIQLNAEQRKEGNSNVDDSEPLDRCVGVLRFAIPDGKRGLAALRLFLTPILEAVQTALYDADSQARTDVRILVADSCLSDSLISILVALLATFYAASSAVSPSSASAHRPVLLDTVDAVRQQRLNLTKDEVRRRLQWIVSEMPTANPSRGHMLRVNEVLLSRR